MTAAVTHHLTLPNLLRQLEGYRLGASTEEALQNQLAEILTREAIAFAREVRLGAAGRIDFFLADSGIGLEVKIDGSPNEVLRQLHRYAEQPTIRALLLVTTRARHRILPPSIHEKPVAILAIWEGALL